MENREAEMPRIFGHDLLAIIASAIAIYVVGMIIYGFVFSGVWLSASGYTEDSFVGVEWKMALSPVMPILTALTLAYLNYAVGSRSLVDHAKVGFAGFVGFGGVAILYAWVYSPSTDLTLI
jgi:hypothetical protein